MLWITQPKRRILFHRVAVFSGNILFWWKYFMTYQEKIVFWLFEVNILDAGLQKLVYGFFLEQAIS